jgi:pimeloyl-ACP methyl ester carboxylesterase
VRKPVRQALLRKDPLGWKMFADGMRAASPTGIACTLRGVQARRPSLWHIEERLRQLKLPTLLVCGDQDEPCLEPNLFLNRVLPDSRLFVFGDSGHAVNHDEPERFNRTLRDFIAHHE